jgi:hypothetical protein
LTQIIKSAASGITTAGGTANTISKFNAGTTVANSGITDNGTTVATTEIASFTGTGNFFKATASTLQKSETGAADANVLTYTPPASAGCYLLSMSLDVSASTAGICGWTATWTDSNGHAQAPTNIIMFASGILAGGLTLTVAANGQYFGSCPISIDNSATNIVIKFTYTSGTLAALITATIQRLA